MEGFKKEYYIVKRMRLLEFLTKKGFNAEKTIPDPDNPKYNWWLFKYTDELAAALNEYFAARV